jgi:hypothetical protein
MSPRVRALLVLLAGAAALSCKEAGCVGGALGNLVGETGDSACDRRYVADGGSRGSFCQEIVDTVAVSQFEDDCRKKFEATTYDGRCTRDPTILAGCKNLKKNDDNSEVWDWYYDVTGIEVDAGDDGGTLFPDAPKTAAEVKMLCADPTRYGDGAEFVMP